MENIKIIARKKALEKSLKEIERKETELIKRLKQLKDDCNHAIIIEQMVETEGLGVHFFEYSYCLFCEEINPYMRKYMDEELLNKMEKSISIRMNDYPLYMQKEKRLKEKLFQIYFNLRNMFPNCSEKQIVEKMKERLEKKEKQLEEKRKDKK